MNETDENFLVHFSDSKTIQEQYPTRLIDFSPNGEHFSYAVNDSLKIYIARTGTLKNIITIPIDTMSYFQNNTILFSRDNNLSYLSIHDNKILRTFESHTDRIKSISVNNTSDTFMSVGKESIKLWDIRYKDPFVSFEAPNCLGSMNRENSFTLANNNFIYIYDIRNFSNPKIVKAIKPNFYKKMWYTPDSEFICLSSFRNHLFLDKNGECISQLNLENDSDGCCIHDSNIFLGGSSKNLLAFKVQDDKRIGRLSLDNFDVNMVRSNPYLSQFIVGSDNSLKIFNRIVPEEIR